MARVIDQIRDHPLMPLLNKVVDTQQGVATGTARKRPNKRSKLPRSILSDLGRAIFRHCVEKWRALPEEARKWYNDNAPPQFCTGFLWWTWSCLIKNYGAGPWTVNASDVGGHSYIAPEGAPEGIWAKGYVDATEIGTLAHIDWEPGCPEENLPILLVHGWYPEPFDVRNVWRAMVYILTGQEIMQPGNYLYVYDPDHEGDPDYALICVEGEGRTVYISNYTHNPAAGTPGDIRQYAQSLAREIQVLRNHRGAPGVDVIAHDMGALVVRAYIENQDFPDNPFPAPFQYDIRGVIMLGPPNQGAYYDNLYPGWWDWTSVQQMEHGSEFLTQLNSGTTGQAQGVTYHVVAGNKYICITSLGVLPTTYHATRLCELTDGEPNDGEVVVRDTDLRFQAGQPDVTPDHYHVNYWNHWELIGTDAIPCKAASLIKIILANYTVAKWRAKGRDIEPPETNWIHRALYKIKQSKTSYHLYNYIVDHDIGLKPATSPQDQIATWDPSANTIVIAPAAEALPTKVLAQHIVREAERARWQAPLSLYQLYIALEAEATFWDEVAKGDTDSHCDLVSSLIAQGRQATLDYLHSLPEYAGLPLFANVEESLWDACLMLDDVSLGHRRLANAMRKGIAISFHELQYDVIAWYHWGTRVGHIHPDFLTEPPEAQADCIGYLCVRAEWDCPDSIEQEVAAYTYAAHVWQALRGSLHHEELDELIRRAILTPAALRPWIAYHPAYQDLPPYYP